jgi:hypothetical protein
MSARAPAVSEKNKRGRVDDAAMSPTHVLDSVNSYISHDPATVWMKVPVAEKMVAAQRARK